jgi:hypothetical protein
MTDLCNDVRTSVKNQRNKIRQFSVNNPTKVYCVATKALSKCFIYIVLKFLLGTLVIMQSAKVCSF